MATRELRDLRSTRDLRSEIVELAHAAKEAPGIARLRVVNPVISVATVEAEWKRIVDLLDASLRSRLRLDLVTDEKPRATQRLALIKPPNYTFEVLRLLIDAALRTDINEPPTQQGLMTELGVSRTPIRAALRQLRDAGIVDDTRALRVEPERLSLDLVSRLGAMPTVIKFRFERGATIRSPQALLKRAETLLAWGSKRWDQFAVSGVPVAQQEVRALDIVGVPRLDLAVHLGRDAGTFDVDLLRTLDDGLELEGNVLEPSPVAVMLVRTEQPRWRDVRGLRCARPADVFFSLLELGERQHALAYAQGLMA